MSDLAPQQPGKPAVKRQMTREQIQAAMKDPVQMLPAALQMPTLRFWMAFSHQKGMESQLAICVQVKTWVDEHNVEPVDVLRAFRRLTDPAVSAKYRFSSDLLADLGALVADERRSRVERQAVAERRQSEPSSAEKAKVRKLLDELMGRTSIDETPAGQSPANSSQKRTRPAEGKPDRPQSEGKPRTR